ncbi:O-antigen ligase family protein [Sphingomonas azotifigens]|uniref:O-antigen ligase family protein n=1 Tax=Sphingomonas azotifigens TaxID=330920 RepID=UPI0009FE7418|nr:O-antigen ligase family protein [Sphingomonas azotifigens]
MRSSSTLNESITKLSSGVITGGILLSMAFGGAGVSYPILSTLIEIIAIGTLCWLVPKLAEVKIAPITWAALLVLLAVLLLPAVQLIPLPWSIWSELPGRDLAAAIRTQAGLAGSPNPLSLRPESTMQDVLALLPPAAAFVSVLFLDERGRVGVLRALVAMALLSAVLGALQLAYGGAGLFAPFDSAHRGDALGLFVNHNHSATFLLIGMVAASVPRLFDGRGRPGAQWPAALGVVTLLALAVLGTTSRTGLLTLPIALLLFAYLRFPRAWNWRWVLFGAVVLAAIAFAVAQTSLAQTTLARFTVVDQDSRQIFWANTLYAIGQFFPWGSGFGTFTAIYPAIEPLDEVVVPIVNHAHNDYLELALEGGLPALVLMAAGLCLIVTALVRALARSEATRWQSRSLTIAAAAIVAIVLLHSADDYPLRMSAISVPFAACIGMLLPRGRRRRSRRVRPATLWVRRGLGLGAGLVLGWQAVSIGAASWLLLRDAPAQAVQWRSGNAEAWSRLATQRGLVSDWSGSADAARIALGRDPMNAAAVRALGLAEAAAHRTDVAGQLMLLAGQLGWRDVPTQLWLIRRSIELNDPLVAVQRADGLLRQDQQTALLFGELRHLLADQASRAAVAKELALRPVWRQAFLASLGTEATVGGEEVASLFRQLAALGAPVDAAEAAALLDGLWRAGRYPEVDTVWRAAGGSGLLVDGGFERSGSELRGIGPFTWQAAGLLGTRVAIETPENAWQGKALLIETRSIATGVAARQRLVLAPGGYALRFLLRDSGPVAMRPAWAIACGPAFPVRAPPLPATWAAAPRGWLQGEVRFAIDADCSAQELRLIVQAARDLQSSWIDDVAISRLPDK